MTDTAFAIGSLVRARGREWVVLPESEGEMLVLRPLGGTDEETAGVYLPLEAVTPARFDLPAAERTGDHYACRLLRDAAKLGFRSSAGPFRSFGRIAVEPRPYQLVPLLMALKLDPVRLLIADDVGIGKTIEAGLIARELLDRGEIRRIAVLALPQIAEQWQRELAQKFHIEAELVLPSTANRLERSLRVGESIMDRYPFVVVSTDYIKSDRRRDDFLRACPEFVIVDEAHTCAEAQMQHGGRQQRHRLVAGIARDQRRHLLLVTATPHSGNEGAFRSLLRLLDPGFESLPEDLSGPANESYRRRLAAHLVQRRRADLRRYLHADTPFPEREELEESYKLTPEYRALFAKALAYARETVADATGGAHRQRVRWWSALALLRSLASSPAAAASTLRSRAAGDAADSAEEADVLGRHSVLDLDGDESGEDADVTPGAEEAGDEPDQSSARARLRALADEADALQGERDAKLNHAVTRIRELVKGGWRPIVFCRFIPTAEYVADALRGKLPKETAVAAVTGSLPHTEREARIRDLAASPSHVLVCTDCLSEGINLQEDFDAIFHYDLSWNPTRHEQREGRVDRYGQPTRTVRILTYYGTDNQIDGIVLDVLLRKHRAIRASLGVAVPVPANSDRVIEAIFEGLLLRERTGAQADQLSLAFDDLVQQERAALDREWDDATAREKRSRTMFAQETIRAELVADELEAAQRAVGSAADVESFTRRALHAYGAHITETAGSGGQSPLLTVRLDEVRRSLRDAIGIKDGFRARFSLPVCEGELPLGRTHPVVEGLASHVMDEALDALSAGPARRCGATRTAHVTRRTTLLLTRCRFHIVTRPGDAEKALLAEDLALLAFEGAPESAEWLGAEAAEALLDAQPAGNIAADEAASFVRRVVEGYPAIAGHIEEAVVRRGAELLAAHTRVRSAARAHAVSQRVDPQLPPDVLGIFVYLPAA